MDLNTAANVTTTCVVVLVFLRPHLRRFVQDREQSGMDRAADLANAKLRGWLPLAKLRARHTAERVSRVLSAE